MGTWISLITALIPVVEKYFGPGTGEHKLNVVATAAAIHAAATGDTVSRAEIVGEIEKQLPTALQAAADVAQAVVKAEGPQGVVFGLGGPR